MRIVTLRACGGGWKSSAALAVGVLLTIAGGAMASQVEGGKSFVGSAVRVGDGDARVVVDVDAAGKPVSLAVVVSDAALNGLPAAKPDQHEWEYVLAMPEGAPETGFDHVCLNWNPGGHPPAGVYSVPHLDVHFYLIGQHEREQVTFQGAGAAEAAKQPTADLLPAGYVAPPDTAVERMGIHGLDPAGPEFNGEPFTQTFVYGYYKGKLIFLEPMVATAFLQTNPDVTFKVARPQSYSYPAYYPSEYRVSHDAARKQYVIAIAGLTPWQMEVVSSLPRK